MKLTDLHTLEGFIAAERYVNLPKYSTTAQVSEVRETYHPRFGAPSFGLPYLRAPRESVELLTAAASASATAALHLCGDDALPLFLHPDVADDLTTHLGWPVDGRLTVAPTSSTRTLVVLDRFPGLMVKTHLPKRISRFLRRLRADSIRHSIAVTRELRRTADLSATSTTWGFLPESVGVIVHAQEEEGFGYVLREPVPYPTAPDRRTLVPLFALFTADPRTPGEPPLVLQIATQIGRDPIALITDDIIGRLLDGWSWVFRTTGLLLEAHGQNTLLELDGASHPRRIIHRDFQSVPVDPTLSQCAPAMRGFTKHIIGENDYPALLEQSLMYDHFIGDYLFRSIESFCHDHLGVTPEAFRGDVRARFRSLFPDQDRFFPRGHVVFASDTLAPDNQYELRLLNEAPAYR